MDKIVGMFTQYFIQIILNLAMSWDVAICQVELENLVREGLKTSVPVNTQLMAAKQATLNRKNSLYALLPVLSLSAGRTFSKTESLNGNYVDTSSTYTNSAEVAGSWTIWDNYSNIRNLKISTLEEEAEEKKSLRDRETFIITFLDSYFEYLVLLRRKIVLEQTLAQNRLTHEESTELVNAGARTKIDAMDTEILVINTERDLLELDQSIRVNLRTLQIMMNKDFDFSVPKVDLTTLEPYYMKSFQNVQTELQRRKTDDVVRNTPDYRVARLGFDVQHERLSQAKFNYWPVTSLRVSHSLNLGNYVRDDVPSAQKVGLNSTTVALSLTWQFFDWGTTFRNVDAAQLDYEISALRFQEEIRNQRAKFEGNLENYAILEKSVLASKKTLEKARQQMDFSREMFKYGRITLLTMQQATSRLFEAEVAYISRKKSLLIHAARLLYYQGISLVPRPPHA